MRTSNARCDSASSHGQQSCKPFGICQTCRRRLGTRPGPQAARQRYRAPHRSWHGTRTAAGQPTHCPPSPAVCGPPATNTAHSAAPVCLRAATLGMITSPMQLFSCWCRPVEEASTPWTILRTHTMQGNIKTAEQTASRAPRSSLHRQQGNEAAMQPEHENCIQ